MSEIRVQITADHIRRGVRSSPLSCPAALAIREATGERWAVYPKTILRLRDQASTETHPGVDDCDLWMETGEPAQSQIEAFDRTGHCFPFSVDLMTGKYPLLYDHLEKCDCVKHRWRESDDDLVDEGSERRISAAKRCYDTGCDCIDYDYDNDLCLDTSGRG